MFFFFSCSTAHRNLHSFPTRRSSDLPLAHRLAARVRQLGGDGGVGSLGVDRVRLGGELDAHRRDRKSTRLNSSHITISYAVFCLKKKKIKYYTHRIDQFNTLLTIAFS